VDGTRASPLTTGNKATSTNRDLNGVSNSQGGYTVAPENYGKHVGRLSTNPAEKEGDSIIQYKRGVGANSTLYDRQLH